MSPVDSKGFNEYTTKVIRGALQPINTGCTKSGWGHGGVASYSLIQVYC